MGTIANLIRLRLNGFILNFSALEAERRTNQKLRKSAHSRAEKDDDRNMAMDEQNQQSESTTAEPDAVDDARKHRRGKSRDEKRSHEGRTIKFRVFPEEAAALKERAAEASMTVSEFCRRASSGNRIISRYDYDVIRRLAELHGDQARLGNLFKLALDMERDQEDTKSINSILSRLARNQELITYILKEVSET